MFKLIEVQEDTATTKYRELFESSIWNNVSTKDLAVFLIENLYVILGLTSTVVSLLD